MTLTEAGIVSSFSAALWKAPAQMRYSPAGRVSSSTAAWEKA